MRRLMQYIPMIVMALLFLAFSPQAKGQACLLYTSDAADE